MQPLKDCAAISVYPNPADSEISITISESLIGSHYTISTIDGVTVKKSTFTTSPEKVNVSGWAAGTYIITYSENGKQATTKFMVK